MEKIRMALVGCGKVAHLHARGLLNTPEADFCAVVSRKKETAEAFASQYAGVKGYSELSTMIRSEKIDGLIVCTPHPYHAEPVAQAASMGVHALVEKPLAASLADCDKMLAASEKFGTLLGVVSQRRFYEPIFRMRRAIDAGKVGKPVLGHAVVLGWRDEAYYQSDPWRGRWDTEGGGVLVNQAPHQLDLFQWLMDDELQEVYGMWGNLNHPYIEVEDTAVAVVRFKKGGMGNLLLSNAQKPGIYGKVHIHGSSGASVGAQTEGGAMFIAGQSEVLEPPVNDLWTVPGEENKLTEWQEEDKRNFQQIKASDHYIQMQDQDFCRAILENRSPAITGAEGRVSVALFSAIYQSQREKKPVFFD